MNANASEKACNGVLRSGLRLTATRVPWCRRNPLWRGDLTAPPKDLKARIKWNAEAVWGQGLGMGRSAELNPPCVADVWGGARRNPLRPLVSNTRDDCRYEGVRLGRKGGCGQRRTRTQK